MSYIIGLPDLEHLSESLSHRANVMLEKTQQVSEYNHQPELTVCLTPLPNSDYPITT